jgi:hypothetical protein
MESLGRYTGPLQLTANNLNDSVQILQADFMNVIVLGEVT